MPLFNFFVQTYGWPVIIIFIALIIWSCIWKGIALYKSANNGDKAWFVTLLLINTVGILEILYIYFFSKKE